MCWEIRRRLRVRVICLSDRRRGAAGRARGWRSPGRLSSGWCALDGAAGKGHSLALSEAGKLFMYSFGSGDCGKLGHIETAVR